MTYEELQEELRQADATIDVLKGALMAETVKSLGVPAWAIRLTPQRRALMGALVAAYPRYLPTEALNDCLPHKNGSFADGVKIGVYYIRKTLGPVIESLYGYGYRASPSFMESLRAQSDIRNGRKWNHAEPLC